METQAATYVLAVTVNPETGGLPEFTGKGVHRQGDQVIFDSVIHHYETPAGALRIVCNPRVFAINAPGWLGYITAADARVLAETLR